MGRRRQSPDGAGNRPASRRRRTLRAAGVALALLAALGLAIYHVATTPYSQPCLSLPEGALVDPVPVTGRASGRAGPLTLALTGDAMLGRRVGERLARDPRWTPWRGLGRALRGVDVLGFNLETSITSSDQTGTWKKYRFKVGLPAATRALGSLPLPAGAARFASVANNHVLDFRAAGLLDTLGALDAASVAHAGAGPNATEAWRPALITTGRGVRVGFLAVADHCGCLRMGRWVAGRDQAGIAWADLSSGRWERLLAAVAALDPAVDVLVVSLHAGPNWLPEGPAPWQRALAEALVEAGADVVWSHSAHHILPVETVRGRAVIYGPGGLVDDYSFHPEYRNDLGLVVRLSIAADGAQSVELVPLHIEGLRARALDRGDPDHAEALRRAAPSPGPAR